MYGHTGALNVLMLYSPTLNMTVTGTLNQSDVPGVWSRVRPVSKLVPELLEIMADGDFQRT